MPIIVYTVHHKMPKAVSDTPNGTHSVESSGHPTAGRTSEAQPLAPEEHSRNGVICGEANSSSGQEAGTEVNEEVKPRQMTPTPPTLQAPPPVQTTPMSPSQPPSLVQSSAAVDETCSERTASVRTAPPALVGYETLEKHDVRSDAPAGEEEMETKVAEARPRDAMAQDTDAVLHGCDISEDKGSVGVGGSGDDLIQQKHEVREESPSLVIDMGSQSEMEGEGAPVIIGEQDTDAHKEKGKQVDTSSTMHVSNSITEMTSESLTQEDQKVTSPESSSSSNDEELELEMDIIEEGEEERGETPPPLPPPLPPPKGTVLKPNVAASSAISSPAHVQSLSSIHPRIGVSPSHTAKMDHLKKGGNNAVRKPNVIMTRPATGGGSTLGGGAGNGSPNKEGGGAGGGGSDPAKDRQAVVTDNFRVRQVAKVKQFFTTLQQFGNKNGSEVAEQVQELITAVVVSSMCMFNLNFLIMVAP